MKMKITRLSLLVLILLGHSVCCQRPAGCSCKCRRDFQFRFGDWESCQGGHGVAASDINEEPSVLNGTKLNANLIVEDVRCSVFMGAIRVQPLSSSISGIEAQLRKQGLLAIKWARLLNSYLTESLHISGSGLISLGSPEEYVKALRLGPSRGGVAAIVDELPYVELFLSRQTDYGIVGQPFTKSGRGFVFQKDSPLVVDMSTTILKLAETRKLQELQEKVVLQAWLCIGEGKKA